MIPQARAHTLLIPFRERTAYAAPPKAPRRAPCDDCQRCQNHTKRSTNVLGDTYEASSAGRASRRSAGRISTCSSGSGTSSKTSQKGALESQVSEVLADFENDAYKATGTTSLSTGRSRAATSQASQERSEATGTSGTTSTTSGLRSGRASARRLGGSSGGGSRASTSLGRGSSRTTGLGRRSRGSVASLRGTARRTSGVSCSSTCFQSAPSTCTLVANNGRLTCRATGGEGLDGGVESGVDLAEGLLGDALADGGDLGHDGVAEG